MTDFEGLLNRLADWDIKFILVGGAAATAHGSARLTLDLDIVYERSESNLQKIVEALSDLQPYLRGAPPGLPFRWDSETLIRGPNFTLTTSLGDLDLLGEITGGGRYSELIAHVVELEVFGVKCNCINLEHLIQVKRAAGRPKDLEAIAELERLRELEGGS